MEKGDALVLAWLEVMPWLFLIPSGICCLIIVFVLISGHKPKRLAYWMGNAGRLTFCCAGMTGLLPALPDGSRPVGLGALALDVAIINSLGASHWDAFLRGPHNAVAAYAQTKRDHLNTAQLCRQAGILFQPLVWDVYGGSLPSCRLGSCC